MTDDPTAPPGFPVVFIDGPLKHHTWHAETSGRIPPNTIRLDGHVYTRAPQTIPPPPGYAWRYIYIGKDAE